MKLLVGIEWLRRKAAEDTDMEVEAGVLHPEAPRPVAKAFMCAISFDHELEGADNGTTLYPSLESLLRSHPHAYDCGIVEVDVAVRQVIAKEKYFNHPRLDVIFRALRDLWQEETAYTSSATEIETNEHLQKIISLGRRVVPLIMEDLRKESSWWFGALTSLTGENPIPEEDKGRVEKMRQHWLRWWGEHKDKFDAHV